jgi:3-phenylpropionate/trans-cinnamate dioxygenase ferredoxin subunit
MTGWINIAPACEFSPGQHRLIQINGTTVAVINLRGEYFAIEDQCSHAGAPMLGCGLEPDDILKDDQIICPRHGARFSIRNGAPLCPPACEPLVTFPVRISNGMVQVRDDRTEQACHHSFAGATRSEYI